VTHDRPTPSQHFDDDDDGWIDKIRNHHLIAAVPVLLAIIHKIISRAKWIKMKYALSFLLLACVGVSASVEILPLRKVVVSVGGNLKRPSLSTILQKTRSKSFDAPVYAGLAIRGGACGDSDPALFVKIAINAIVETGAMLGVLVGTQKLAEKVQIFPTLAGLPLIQWIGLFTIIFASSLIGSIVSGGLNVASNQVLDPNVVPGDSEWYSKLIKPSWNPPGWLFPIMWLVVSKPTQMIAVSRILKKAMSVSSDVDTATELPLPILAIYCAHLSLGDAWNKVFFGLQCIGWGTAVITTFFGMLLTSAYVFYQVDPSAGLYLLPTCGWVLVASALNWNIYLKNK
jgi:benzodiazapine receptor